MKQSDAGCAYGITRPITLLEVDFSILLKING